MKTILVAGVGEPAGKTAIIAGMAASILEQGQSVSYLKVANEEDGDVRFVREALRISAGAGRQPDSADVVLAEWPGPLGEAAAAAASLGAAILTVIRYRQGLASNEIAALLHSLANDGKAALGAAPGVIINGVPERILPLFGENVVAPLRNGGANVHGVIPETRPLLGFTVGELAQGLGASFLVHPETQEGLIENLMLGANAPDPAVSYFAPRPNSAVICRSDRPDIQLAALDNPIRCLVFCGGGYRQTSVLYRAEDLGVPVLEVESGVLETLARLNIVAEHVRFRQAEKIAIARELIKAHVAFDGVLTAPALA